MSKLLTKTSPTAIMNQLKKWFDQLGWPQTIRSGGGPQYRTEFDQFCKKHIKHKLTSPHKPRKRLSRKRSQKCQISANQVQTDKPRLPVSARLLPQHTKSGWLLTGPIIHGQETIDQYSAHIRTVIASQPAGAQTGSAKKMKTSREQKNTRSKASSCIHSQKGKKF